MSNAERNPGKNIRAHPKSNTTGVHLCRIYSKRPVVCRTFLLRALLCAPDETYVPMVAGMSEAEKEKLTKTNAAFWTESQQAQAKSDWFKEKT